MRLGIDARLCGSEHRGIGRYTESLLNSLLDGPNDLVVFVAKGSSCLDLLRSKNCSIIEVENIKPYSWKEQTDFLKTLKDAKCDLIHFPHFNVPIFYTKPYIVTIHDLILHHFPNRNGSRLNLITFWLKYLAYRFVVWNSILRSRHIIAVSEYTKEDILDHYTVPEQKISVVHESLANELLAHYEDDTKIWYNKYGKYALYYGAAYPHKNLKRLIESWSKVGANTQTSLVLAVPKDDFSKQLILFAEKKGLLDQTYGIFFNYSPDEDSLMKLIDQSLFIINPSLFEGVGLPGLEALARGKRLLSSAESVAGETYGKSATYLDVNTVHGIEDGLLRASNSTNLSELNPSYPMLNKEELLSKLVAIYNKATSTK